ncbi:AraC family transcriptional regulator [Dyella terrae]|uniref:AraC family transcriptional regulator n=1 Tax=Dyella terrae TaxID=522259 RepID=UPI001EFE1FE8|nr:AraC family transcriptional regulator [Dyella terrae]ULU26563.1 helix-turn-helix domain-containing protein [Dyella terrae]
MSIDLQEMELAHSSADAYRVSGIDAIRHSLSEIYGFDAVRIDPLCRVKNVSSERRGREFGHIGYSHTHYDAPVKVHVSPDIGETFFIKFASANNTFQLGTESSRVGSGIVVPVQQIAGHEGLAYENVHISKQKLLDFCSRWIGRSLDLPPIFKGQPFSHELSALWAAVTMSMDSLMHVSAVPELMKNNLTDYAISLLMQMHPHTYSDAFMAMQRLSRAQVNRAKGFIVEQAHADITSEDVAAYLDCSTASLNHSFLHFEGVTPRQMLYRERLERARDELRSGDAPHPDETWIRDRGFVNTSGFRLEYHRRFGEHPEETSPDGNFLSPTARRSRATHHRTLSNEGIHRLLTFIQQRLSEKISLEGLAAQAGVSKQDLIAAFKHHLSMTPLQCVIAERVSLARHRLETTDQSLVAIAIDAGFNSQSHMATVFKEETGMSPGQYRKHHQST